MLSLNFRQTALNCPQPTPAIALCVVPTMFSYTILLKPKNQPPNPSTSNYPLKFKFYYWGTNLSTLLGINLPYIHSGLASFTPTGISVLIQLTPLKINTSWFPGILHLSVQLLFMSNFHNLPELLRPWVYFDLLPPSLFSFSSPTTWFSSTCRPTTQNNLLN
jgi:hypothetical protein